MTKQNLTDITIVLDKSSSMAPDKNKTRDAINEFIKGQKNANGECRISLFTFSADDRYDKDWLQTIWEGINIKEISELSPESYQPNGNTALYDATGLIIEKTGKRLAAMKEEDRPSKVLFVTQSDGQENSSRIFNLQKLKEKIAVQENTYSWNFLFLGADFSTKEQTSALGLEADRSYDFSKTNFVASYKGLSRAVVDYRCSGSGTKLSRGFTDVVKTYADQESN